MKNYLIHRRRRVDGNHAIIKKAFEAMGFAMQDLSGIGKGCPDLAVSKHGQTCLVEIKTEDGDLTTKQEKFIERWRDVVQIVRTTDDVKRLDDLLWARRRI